MTTEEALVELGESTAEAVAGLLRQFAPDAVERGQVIVGDPEADALAGVATPAVAASVSYVDGITGGNVFVVARAAGRKLAAAMMGAEPEDGDGDLSELELSAVSEAMNQMMATAAGATGKVLGQEVQIGAPESILLDAGAGTAGILEHAAHVITVGFTVFGEPCRLVQLIPNAFVVRMSRALDRQEGELFAEAPADGAGGFDGEVIRDIRLRLWAELGRARLPVGRAVGLSPGSVLELDRRADDPVDLYANGRRLAVGRLLLTEDDEWAVEVESISPDPSLTRSVQGRR